jgi:hypothetical protein
MTCIATEFIKISCVACFTRVHYRIKRNQTESINQFLESYLNLFVCVRLWAYSCETCISKKKKTKESKEEFYNLLEQSISQTAHSDIQIMV